MRALFPFLVSFALVGATLAFASDDPTSARARATSHLQGRGRQVVRADVLGSEGGVVRVAVHGIARADGQTTLFAREVTVGRTISDVELTTPSPAFAGCRRSFDACRDACRDAACVDRCVTAATRCLFGTQELARLDDARLVVEAPLRDPRARERPATLHWGPHELSLFVATRNAADAPDDSGVETRLTFEALSRRTRLLVLSMRLFGDEDPPTERRYFLRDTRGIREIADPQIANTRVDGELPGDGTIRMPGSPWGDCERQGYPAHARRTEVIVRVDDDGTVRSAVRRRVPGRWSCEDLPACPFVDVIEPDGPRRVGEILRHVRERPETRALALESRGASGRRVLQVRIAEEKPETTFVDSVALVVDGGRIPPDTCESTEPPAYCEADGRYFELREGEALNLVFGVPPGGPAALEVHGYYRPDPLD
ncbi:MAG: hypothetical protein KC586_02250 [Myxococcales bacterium]|nr:hypothetical protein [Myxococcales bacterium]